MPSFKYELPQLVKSLQEGWLISCKTAAVFSALLAVLAGHLLAFMKDSSNFPKTSNSNAHKFLVLVSYSAVVFNCSAAMSSLVLTDKLGELPIRAARISEDRNCIKSSNDLNPTLTSGKDLEGGGARDGGTTNDTSIRLLVRYGAGEMLIWIMVHWLICLTAGIFSIMIQLLVYIFLEEPKAVQITMTCVVVFTVFPPFIFLLKHSKGKVHEKADINSLKYVF